MDSAFNWKPEQTLLEKIINLARQRGQSPESLVSEAVSLYLETQWQESIVSVDSDPLVGLFAGTTDLATNSEDILEQEITEKSGWTWKELNP